MSPSFNRVAIVRETTFERICVWAHAGFIQQLTHGGQIHRRRSELAHVTRSEALMPSALHPPSGSAREYCADGYQGCPNNAASSSVLSCPRTPARVQSSAVRLGERLLLRPL